ncbi:Nitroreductase family protein [Candidatus Anstonella stagnisolia]|nr:Nitroreductase family protein [Candidatus Anstonella stagnisolia]
MPKSSASANACDFLKLAKERKTIYEFSGREVGKGELGKILEAARWAPSAHNSQDWKFIVVEDASVIDALVKACHYGAFYTRPALAIAVVAEPVYAKKPGLLRGKASQLAPYHRYLNVAMPVANMVYEAASLGIGTCILSPIVEEANGILGVPKGSETVLIVGFGYEKEGAYQKKRERKSLEETASYGKYR